MLKYSFLQLLAKDLIKKHDHTFDQLTIVFPNKRAGLFLADELSKLIGRPVWMPKIVTLNEFVEQRVGLKKADELILIIKLYKAYINVSGSEEKFEDFYFWGNMLLSDFDDIDKYLANAKDVFSNLVALKEVEYNFPYLTEEQIEVIKTFWSCFNPEKQSREQEEFLHVWDKLYPTYIAFKQALEKESLCYEGMAQRYFCEHITEYPVPEQLIFAGFNALNSCEKKMFSFYRECVNADFYWDYDIYYTANEDHEAGLYMRDNLRFFPNALDISNFNNFLYNGKQIEYISVPSSVGQAKLIPTLTSDMTDKDNHNTAIVLCDERMLIPAIHSIPDDIQKINITMGYPAQNTSVAALISILGDLRNHMKKEGEVTYYYYKQVVALLNHKLVKSGYSDDINRITDYINRNNIVYVPENMLQFSSISQAVFSSVYENTLGYLLATLELLTCSFSSDEDEEHCIEKEFIFTLYTQLQCLQNTFREEQIVPDDKLYMQIINKVLLKTSVPFSGEPLEGIQLMGLMETRMLDFKNLIIMSANEGIIPKNSVASSFIPYNLRAGFLLPTPEHQDALFAYYFYRLLQRAENIKILYSSASQGLNSGEMSRFLYQIKYESGLNLKETAFQNSINIQENVPIKIAKDEEVQRVLASYTMPDEKMMSPSALNIYMECPLRFYFRYVASIKENEEIAEELDSRLLGTIFHNSIQSLYMTIPDGHVTGESIERILKNNGMIEEHIERAYFSLYDSSISKLIDSGTNELVLQVVNKYIRQVLQYDLVFCPFEMIAMEEKYKISINIGTPEMPCSIYIGGDIDRVDRVESGIRVIDYKTGADKTDFKELSSIFDSENKTRNKAAFQTMLYCLMFDTPAIADIPLIPGIYSTKLLFTRDFNYMLKCNKDYINNFHQYKEEFTENLTALLQEIYNPDIPFCQTDNQDKCKNCSYAGICIR